MKVVLFYLSRPDDPEGPLQTLRAFKRVSIPKGETVEVSFSLDEK